MEGSADIYTESNIKMARNNIEVIKWAIFNTQMYEKTQFWKDEFRSVKSPPFFNKTD